MGDEEERPRDLTETEFLAFRTLLKRSLKPVAARYEQEALDDFRKLVSGDFDAEMVLAAYDSYERTLRRNAAEGRPYNPMVQYSVTNTPLPPEEIGRRRFFDPARCGENAGLAEQYNRVLNDKMREGCSNIRRERYITYATAAADPDRAARSLASMSTRVSEAERIYAAIVSGSLGKGAVVEAAQEAAGWEAPYLWGGTDPHGGIDCSGLTQWCYAQAGIDIPHQSEQQRDSGQVVPVSEAQPGDILWMPGHVGIYIDPDTCVEATPPRVRMTHGDVASRWTCAVRIG